MPLTNYPNGLSSYGIPLTGAGPLSVLTTGNVYFVNSAIGNNSPSPANGMDPTVPFATIDYAIGQCRASKNDVIYVVAGHAETITGAAAIAADIAGISIIGLGQGTNRPVITFGSVGTTIAISAANVTFKNLIIAAGVDEIVKAFLITAAFVTLDTVDLNEVTAKQFIQFVLTTAAADNLTIQNCTHYQATAAAANSLWIQLIGADRAKILNNSFMITTTNSASSSVIEGDTTASLTIQILENLIVQLGGTSVVPINLFTGTTGFVGGNWVASLKTAIAGSIACASCYAAQNYAGHVVNTSGILEPVADA